MKRKVCNLLKVTTGLELGIAAFMLCWLLYTAIHFSRALDSGDKWVLYGFAAGAVLQIVYTILIIQLMLCYVNEQKTPNKGFMQLYKGMAGLNVLVATGLVFLFGYGLKQSLAPEGEWIFPWQPDFSGLCIVGTYAIVSVYTLAGAAKLKRALLQENQATMELWLEQLDRVRVGH